MIQLANDPHASRSFQRAAANDGDAGKALAAESQRARSGHAWPFLSRYAAQPARRQESSDKPAAHENGS
jgi:hypothetical protein